jgi:hypothetical protein
MAIDDKVSAPPAERESSRRPFEGGGIRHSSIKIRNPWHRPFGLRFLFMIYDDQAPRPAI